MANLRWDVNKDGVYRIMNTYFGVTFEWLDAAVKKKFPTERDKSYLVAMVGSVANICKAGKPAQDLSLTSEDLKDRKKSAEAIFSFPNFSDASANAVYYRLKDLFTSIHEKGIDVYKTIWVTSLTDGNLGVYYNSDNASVQRYENFDRDFSRIYNKLIDVLAIEPEKAAETVNGIYEKCAATMISKVTASSISNVYQTLLSFAVFNPDDGKRYYLFYPDKKYIGMERRFQKVRAIRDGLIACPTLFSCKPERISEAYNYVMKKVPQNLVLSEFKKAQSEGRESMTMFECRRHVLRSWINNNFSVLTINAEKMQRKEALISNVQANLNHEFGGLNYESNFYDFSFLFDNPASISLMNSIPIEKMQENAYRNVYLLEKYAGVEGATAYIQRNPYALAMDNFKLSQLLRKIEVHDKENSDNPYMGRFLKIGKALFANKHNIDFDVEPVFKKLAKIEDIEILDIDKMSDWQRISKFVELFCDNDPRIVPHIQKLYHEKLKKDEMGSSELRKQIRTMLVKNGGWDVILKDRKKMLSITTELKSINEQRFIVEQVEKTGESYVDFYRLHSAENAFSDDIKSTLANLRNAYSQKRDKLNKRFSDVDKLYEIAIEFLTEKCFDDKEPMSVLVETELRVPLIETLKQMESTYVDPQQTLFGAEKVIAPIPDPIYSPLKKLTSELAKDADDKMESDVIKITRAKDGEGK